MFDIVLYEPEIPPNTGNIIRLCANTGSNLHLVHPLGFELGDKQLRRAGLDYHDLAHVHEHPSLEACLEVVKPRRLLACSTRGRSNYSETHYEPGDALLFDYRIVHRSGPNAGTHRRSAVSWRWLGDDAVWAPKPGADPIIRPQDTRLNPGERITDDAVFPLAHPVP